MVRVDFVDATYAFEFIGGSVCLDLANTVGSRASDEQNEHLKEYADLVEWARQGGLATDAHARHLLAEAARRPAAAKRTFADAIALREAIFRAFSARAHGEKPAAADVRSCE